MQALTDLNNQATVLSVDRRLETFDLGLTDRHALRSVELGGGAALFFVL